MAVGTLPPQKGALSSSKSSVVEWLLPAVRSTIGAKFLVALTGLGLVGFLFGHMAGNLLIYKGRDALNAYAMGLKNLGPLLWVARIGLLALFLSHLGLALKLKLRNKSARPEPYRYQATVQASLASRTMVLSGLVILAFVVYHLLHFTLGVTQATPDGHNFLSLTQTYRHDGEMSLRHDVYGMVVFGFQKWYVSAVYIVAQLILGLHLSHGISSVFQTLGWNAPRWWPLIQRIGLTLTILLVVGNCSIPLAVLFGLVK